MMDPAFGFISPDILLNPKSQDFSLCFFWNLWFYALQGGHFEVNFVYCVRYGLKFIFSRMDTELCHTIY